MLTKYLHYWERTDGSDLWQNFETMGSSERWREVQGSKTIEVVEVVEFLSEVFLVIQRDDNGEDGNEDFEVKAESLSDFVDETLSADAADRAVAEDDLTYILTFVGVFKDDIDEIRDGNRLEHYLSGGSISLEKVASEHFEEFDQDYWGSALKINFVPENVADFQ